MTNPNVPQGPNNDDTRAIPYIQTPDSYVIPGPPPDGPYVHQTPQEPTKKGKTGIIVAIVLIIAAIIVAGCIGLFSVIANSGKEGVKDGLNAGTEQTVTPSTSATSEAPKSDTVKIGKSLVDKRDGFQATYVLSKPEQKTTDEFGLKPKRGVFLLVYMQASVQEGSDYICSCNLQFVGPDGTVYEEEFNSFAGKDSITANDVGKGQKIAGWTSFDVPKAALKGGKIQLKPNMFDGDRVGYWAL
jgi:hypothetical protein